MKGTRQSLDRLAREEGLLPLGVVSLACGEDYERFAAWLEEGRHAGMEFLSRHSDLRKDPRQLLPGARVALILGLPYFLGDTLEGAGGRPRVAQYARLPDYHRTLRAKAEAVFTRLAREIGLDAVPPFRVTVDSAPVLERALAAKSAAGFIGKNTCYIHPTLGSFLLLAEVFTTLDLEVDEKRPIDPIVKLPEGGCGACSLCQDRCPTGALQTDYSLDSKRCLAYWTIEHRGTIPEEFWPWLGTYYFGCDLCQLACPYNWKATGNKAPASWKERVLPSLYETAVMGQAEYERYFGGTPLTRAKRNGLMRNALIAMTVTSDPRLAEALAHARRDADPVILATVRQIERWLAEADDPHEVDTRLSGQSVHVGARTAG